MTNDGPQEKRGLLAAVMIGILAVSVAVAWLTTRPKKDTSPSGAEIIAKLADDTLEGYWTSGRWNSCFIGLKGNTKPISWQIESRGLESEGVFAGSLLAGDFRPARRESIWRLKIDLSEGNYVSREYDDGLHVLTETRITLTANEITVVRGNGDQELTATSARPDNYVPEGAFSLVLRHVARHADTATVKMIFDEAAIARDGTVNFVNARLAPHGDNAVRVEYYGLGGTFTIVYHLDPDHDHEIDRYVYPAPGIIYRRCERELVTKTFRIPDEESTTRSAPTTRFAPTTRSAP